MTDTVKRLMNLAANYADAQEGFGKSELTLAQRDNTRRILEAELLRLFAPLTEPVAEITSVDEYGPKLGWYEHWAQFPVGTKLYTPAARKPSQMLTEVRAMFAPPPPAELAVEPCCHDLYTTDDKDKPSQICDRDGHVVLSMCKICGKAESELTPPATDVPTLPIKNTPTRTGVFKYLDSEVRKDMAGFYEAFGMPQPPAESGADVSDASPSPTAGMNIAQRILHVGGRNNAAGYIEFGSIQSVQALVRQVLRDLSPTKIPILTDDEIETAMYAARPHLPYISQRAFIDGARIAETLVRQKAGLNERQRAT